jgi:hypothetical protein
LAASQRGVFTEQFRSPNLLPGRAVRPRKTLYDEMIVGSFDVAVAADLDLWKYFMRGNSSAPAR